MGLLAPKIEGAQALKTIASEVAKPWYKKGEYWVGIVANIIAMIALLK
jgi:hypothetical protein